MPEAIQDGRSVVIVLFGLYLESKIYYYESVGLGFQSIMVNEAGLEIN